MNDLELWEARIEDREWTDERGWGSREEWGQGPWQREPNRIEWRSVDGYTLIMVRNHAGAWRGYVGVPPGHPWHGVDYEKVEPWPDVHGGLTYADKPRDRIAATLRPGEPVDTWFLGFDCAHAGDIAPAMAAFDRKHHGHVTACTYGTYRDVEYVRGECISLARQAAEANTGGAT